MPWPIMPALFAIPKILISLSTRIIVPLLQATIAPGTGIYTEAYDMYSRLEPWGYAHESVCHSRGNMHGMTTGMAFMKYTSTPWKAFGPCCGRGFARIVVSHRIFCRSIWASLHLFTMRDDGAKRYWELCWSSCSRSSLESILSLNLVEMSGQNVCIRGSSIGGVHEQNRR